MSGDLQQFVGATIRRIGSSDDESVWLDAVLADGSQRDLVIYHAHHEPVAVRIDGMYVPPEEL